MEKEHHFFFKGKDGVGWVNVSDGIRLSVSVETNSGGTQLWLLAGGWEK